MNYHIDLARDFSEFPFGRNSPHDGDFTGEAFREGKLKPIFRKMKDGDTLTIDLNGVKIGIGSSFFSESFEVSIQRGYISKDILMKSLVIVCDDKLYEEEIRDYIAGAELKRD